MITTEIKKILKDVSSKGFFHLFAANIFIQLVSFGSQLFVADILSPDDIGRIKIVQIFTSFFVILGGLGFNVSILKICSEQNSKEYKRLILSSGVLLSLVGSLLAYGVVIFGTKTELLTEDSSIVALAPLAFLPIVFINIFARFVGYLQAIKEIKLLSAITIANKILTIVLIIIFTYFWKIEGYFYAQNIGMALIVMVVWATLKGENLTLPKRRDWGQLLSDHWKYAKPSIASNLLAELTTFVDIFIINFMVTNITEIGYYSFALTLIVALRILPATVQQISNPYFSERGKDKEFTHKTLLKYGKLLTAVIVGTFILFILLVPMGIDMFFAKYHSSIKYLIPLSVAWSIRQFSQILSSAIFGLGRIDYTAYAQSISLCVNLIIIPFCIYQWGIYGAAWGMIPCSIFNISILYYFYKRALK